jgi:hypothetical protein
MDEVYANAAWTLQGLLDILANTDATLEFKKTLKWQIKPGWTLPVEALPAAPIVKDTRTREQKLRDAGQFVRTDRASAEDVAADKARHDAARNKLKVLFDGNTNRAEFDRKLHDVNVYVEVLGNRIDRAKTNRVKEQMRVELRKQYPQFSELLKQPESERDTKW